MHDSGVRRKRFGLLLTGLTVLFALRVAGQAVQRWIPQSFLPTVDAFQGSNRPYSTLLTIQLLILGLLIRSSWRVWSGRSLPLPPLGRGLAWFGAIYLTGSILRIDVGMWVSNAHSWFSAWIPAFFHLVLAFWVLVLSAYHLPPFERRDDA
ncbi:MAG: hypothetical protein ABL878_05590 [Burkholderiales bacterium]